MSRIFYVYLILLNAAAFCLYGIDKKRAVRRQWRIPEKMLLGIAALGGSPGALLGMYFFHHKTRKRKFSMGVPGILILEAVLFFWITGQGA